MKKVTIIGLGWVGLPLAQALLSQGIHVVGTKTTADGIEAAQAVGIECYALKLTPELECDDDDLSQLMTQSDAIVILLPPSKVNTEYYVMAIETLVNSAIAFQVPKVIFTSSTAVYGEQNGEMTENSLLEGVTGSAKALVATEQWLHQLPNISVDILRLAGLVGEKRHAGRFLAGKTGVKGANQPVNMVHQDDVIDAILLLLQQRQGEHIYNLCAPIHPTRAEFYTHAAQSIGLVPPQFIDEENALVGKIINGNKICQELGFEYQYPNPSLMNMTL
ncbi:SDR family oxidoreductase [Providencia rettgeri]|uniref:SDR family oxidoreductase n=1 Tax=Providencia rettgeri TaxID=587 RepID=A0AAD2VMM6_PRORE|nr:SDR family oxidoreductase [Providencia stuartii]ELR5215782.1 SDR family oxidoreductase [Providencia rettgeri]